MLAAAAETDVKGRRREQGHPTQMVGFRCPEELLDVANKIGANQTAGLVLLLDLANDAIRAMGKDWIEVEVLAHRADLEVGEALARLAKEALDRKPKK